jgi:general secretion pathway protein C
MQMRKNWTIRLATLVLWLLAAASVVFWALKFVQGAATPANAAVIPTNSLASIDSAALARGLGGGAVANLAAPAAASSISAARFVLSGIVTGNAARENLALIAVDGKPAKPYRIGAMVADGIVLKSLENRQAALSMGADAPTGLTLELPKQNSAIVGTAIPVSPKPVATAPTITTAAADPNAVAAQNLARPGPIRPRPGKEGGKEAAKMEAPASGIATQ